MKQVVSKNNLGADFILDVPNSKIYSNQILTGTVAPSTNPSVTGKRWLWINTAVGIITHYWNGSAWINLVDADKGDITVSSNGTDVGTRQKINFIEGTNVTMTVADNAGSDRVDVTINATIQDNIRLSTVSDSIGSTDSTVVYTNAVTSSLPSPVNKRKVTIKNGNASTYINIVGHIDGTASSNVSVPPKNSMTFHSDGNTWYVI